MGAGRFSPVFRCVGQFLSSFISFYLVEILHLACIVDRSMHANDQPLCVAACLPGCLGQQQTYADTLAVDEVCGSAEIEHSTAGKGENVFVCATSGDGTPCFSPEAAMAAFCESDKPIIHTAPPPHSIYDMT